jgi:cell wall-associated NlpC family hydrolase
VFISLRRSSCSSHFCLVIVSLAFAISSASANLRPFPSIAASLKETSIDDVVDRAHELLGTPYKWGGASAEQGSIAAVSWSTKTQANIQIPRTTAAMHRSTASTVARSALKPGDAVFFKGNGRGQVSHVGLHIGEATIHSPRTGKNVRIDSLSNRYWNKHYTTAALPRGGLTGLLGAAQALPMLEADKDKAQPL